MRAQYGFANHLALTNGVFHVQQDVGVEQKVIV